MSTPKNPQLKPNYNLRPSKSPSPAVTNSPSPQRRIGNGMPANYNYDNKEDHQTDDEFEYESTPKVKYVTRETQEEPGPGTEEYRREKSSRSLGYIYWMGAIIVLIVGIASYLQGIKTETAIKHCKFDKLQKLYSGQEDYLWESLEVSLEDIINGRTSKPAVFLFLYEQNATNEVNIIDRIADKAAACFDPSLKPRHMKPSDFSSAAAVEDYGAAIEKYRNIITEGSVLLIAKLNDIPPRAARSLHAICDVHSPIVNRVMIFLTLEVPSLKKEVKHVAIAEVVLRKMWKKDMQDSELSPLITRVTDEVVVVRRR